MDEHLKDLALFRSTQHTGSSAAESVCALLQARCGREAPQPFFETLDNQYELGVDNLPFLKVWWTSEGLGHVGANLRGDNSGGKR